MSRAPEWIDVVRRHETRRQWKQRKRRRILTEDGVAHVLIALGLLGLMVYGWAVGP